MKHLQQNEKHLADKLQHLPAPDVEQSWEKMRRLLDREMPEAAVATWSGNGKWWWMGITAGVIMLAVWLSQQFNQPNTAVAGQAQVDNKKNTITDNKNKNNTNTSNNKDNKITNTNTDPAPNTNATAQPNQASQQTTSSTGSITSVNTGSSKNDVTGASSPAGNKNNNDEKPRRNYTKTPVTTYLNDVSAKTNDRSKPSLYNTKYAVASGRNTTNDKKNNTTAPGTTNDAAPDIRSITTSQAEEREVRYSNYSDLYVTTVPTPSDVFNMVENTEPDNKIIAGKTDRVFTQEMRKKSMKADDRRMSRSRMRGSSGEKERDITFAAGLALPQNIAVSGQHSSPYNVNAKNSRFTDYLPAPYFQYHINPRLFVHTEFHFQSPQYTQQLLLSKTEHAFGNTTRTSTVHLEKLYYFNIPFNVYYSPARNFYIGGGLQYSSLQGGVARFEFKEMNGQTQVAYDSRMQRFSDDSSAAAFRPSEWRYQFDANYNFNRFTLGMRYNRSTRDFINLPTAQGRNTAFLMYLRFNIWEERRKD